MTQDTDKIAIRAYQLSRDRFGGHAPLDDWLKAEWEVNNNLVQETGEKTRSRNVMDDVDKNTLGNHFT